MAPAEKLIRENIRAKNTYLELGNCGLTGNEPYLQLLEKCEHLETLVFSNEWYECDSNIGMWFRKKSQNKGKRNKLAYLPKLPVSIKKLVLTGGFEIKDIPNFSTLEELKKLTSDYNYDNSIKDFSELSELGNLTDLHIVYNQIADISFVKDLKKLTHLYVSNNQICDVSCLKELDGLTHLDLNFNQIKDISVLENLTNLIHLGIGNNQISDIRALKKLSKLNYVSLNVNPFYDTIPKEIHWKAGMDILNYWREAQSNK